MITIVNESETWVVGLDALPSRDGRPLIVDQEVDRHMTTLVYRRNAQQSLVLTGHSGMICAVCCAPVWVDVAAAVLFTEALADDVELYVRMPHGRRVGGTVAQLREFVIDHGREPLLPAAIGAHVDCAVKALRVA